MNRKDILRTMIDLKGKKVAVTGVSSMIGGKGPLTMVSESFLGREPSRQECIERICSTFSAIDGGSCSSHTTIYDNGC